MPSTHGAADGIELLVATVRATRLPSPDERQRIRRASGVSLRSAAQALDVDPMTISRWERGLVNPSLEHARQYRRLLDQLEDAAHAS